VSTPKFFHLVSNTDEIERPISPHTLAATISLEFGRFGLIELVSFEEEDEDHQEGAADGDGLRTGVVETSLPRNNHIEHEQRRERPSPERRPIDSPPSFERTSLGEDTAWYSPTRAGRPATPKRTSRTLSNSPMRQRDTKPRHAEIRFQRHEDARAACQQMNETM
jgi:hypothetical protein